MRRRYKFCFYEFYQLTVRTAARTWHVKNSTAIIYILNSSDIFTSHILVIICRASVYFEMIIIIFFLGSKLCQVLCAAEMETWKKILSQRWFAAAFLYSYSIRCHYNRLYIISLLRVSERYSVGLNSFIENDGLKKKKIRIKLPKVEKLSLPMSNEYIGWF